MFFNVDHRDEIELARAMLDAVARLEPGEVPERDLVRRLRVDSSRFDNRETSRSLR